MVYNTAKPAPNDNLDVSVTDIQQNFLTANTVMAVDHFPFDNVTANQGKHKKVQLVVQPDPPTVIGQGTAYCKAAGFGTEAQLFWRFAALATPLQITGTQFATGATNGYVPLFNGMMLQWGRIATTGLATSVLFATNNVNFQANCFTVNVTPNVAAVNNSQQFTVINKNNLGFTLGVNSGYPIGSLFFWTAIGN